MKNFKLYSNPVELAAEIEKNVVVYLCENGLPTEQEEKRALLWEIHDRISRSFGFDMAEAVIALIRLEDSMTGAFGF